MIRLVIILLLFCTLASAQTVTIDPNTSLQTWSGLEANAIIGQNAPICCSGWAAWQQEAVDKAIATGVRRLRVGIRSGMENTTDYYLQFVTGQIDAATYNPTRYVPINDNSDPNVMNPAGFQWKELDHQMEAIGTPLRNALLARGEKLWINICFTDFADSSFDFQNNPAEYGELVLAVYQHMQTTYGFVPDSWELLLEPDAGADQWTAAQVSDASAAARTRLIAAGYVPYFIGPSVTAGGNAITFYNAMKSHDAAGVASIREISWHEYQHNDNSGLTDIANLAATEGKFTAMLEFIGLSYGNALDYGGSNDHLGFFQLIKFGKNVALEQYSFASNSATDDGGKFYYINTSTNSLEDQTRTRFYRQFFKYLKKGAVRKGSSTTDTNFDCIPFLNVTGNWSVGCRALTSGTFTTTGLPNGTYHRFYSTTSEVEQTLSDVTVSGGSPSFTTTMPAAGLVTFYQNDPGTFWASPTGSGTACSLASPCSLHTALAGNSGAITAGARVKLNGGTYNGKYTASLSGAAGNNIVVESADGQWAKIDEYFHTTLNGTINNTDTTITLTNASGYDEGDVIVFADTADPADNENVLLGTKASNTFTGCTRAWNGTTAQSHTTGAEVILGGNGLLVTGNYVTYKNFEIMSSDPIRAANNADTSSAPHKRGSVVINAANNSFVNLVLHDLSGGFLTNNSASGTILYGNLIANGGYKANLHSDVYLGHNIYTQNSTGTFSIKHNIVFGAYFFGMQIESATGNTIGYTVDGNVIFNNGAILGTNVRRAPILLGAQTGTATGNIITGNYIYQPTNTSAGGVRLGYGTDLGTTTFTNNKVKGGHQGFEVRRSNDLTVTGNDVAVSGSGSSADLALYESMAGTVNFNNNTYRNVTASTLPFGYANTSTNYNFADWKTTTGVDASSTYSTSALANEVFIIPNDYEVGRGTVVIYNWTQASSISVNLSTLGMSSGQPYVIRDAQNYFAAPVFSGIYNSSSPSINITMTGLTAAPVIGSTFTPAHTAPEFGVFVVLPVSTLSNTTLCSWHTNPACATQ